MMPLWQAMFYVFVVSWNCIHYHHLHCLQNITLYLRNNIDDDFDWVDFGFRKEGVSTFAKCKMQLYREHAHMITGCPRRSYKVL